MFVFTSTCPANYSGSVCATREYLFRFIINMKFSFVSKAVCTSPCQNQATCTGMNMQLFRFHFLFITCFLAPNQCTCLPGYNGSTCQYRMLIVLLKLNVEYIDD